MFPHANKLFLVLIVISSFTYFERADYNLPLFAFALLLWELNDPQQKGRLWYLMTFSLLTDFIWLVYWGSVWNSYNNEEQGVCTWTTVLSVIGFIVKIATVIILFVKDSDCNNAMKSIPQNIKSIFQTPKNDYSVV